MLLDSTIMSNLVRNKDKTHSLNLMRYELQQR